MKKVVFFHRNKKAGFSIDKVTQTVVSKIENKKEFYVPFWGASLKTLMKNIFFVCKRKDKKSINHITGDIHYCILGLFGTTSVLTIHDIVSLKFNSYSFFKRKIIEYLWFRIPLRMATKVVCISEETKKSVLNYTNRQDIVVIHDAVSPKMSFSPKEINLECPRILCVGTSQNKNLLRTFDALKGITCVVVVVGKMNEQQIGYLNKNNLTFENKWNLSDEEVVDEYRKSDIISFISLYEGFGMPIVEANAIGRPVVCSDIAVLHEVANDAAEFVNPLSVEDIHNAFVELKNNKSLVESLVQKGVANASRFDCDKILEEWKRLYFSLN